MAIYTKILIELNCYLQQSMRGNFYNHSIIWYMVESLLEEHRADQVIDVVLRRRVEC